MSNFNIKESKLEEYAIRVKDFCLANGNVSNKIFIILLDLFMKFDLNYLGLICIENDQNSIKTHNSAYPVPVTLFPTQFPKKQFDFAIEIQKHFNELVHNISNDSQFLKETLNK